MKDSFTHYMVTNNPEKVKNALKIRDQIDTWEIEDIRNAVKLIANRETKKMLHAVLEWKSKQI